MTEAIDSTHDMGLISWVEDANGHPDFPVQNLPFGCFLKTPKGTPHIGMAIGSQILDLHELPAPDFLKPLVKATSLNELMAVGPEARRGIRKHISAFLCDPEAAAMGRAHLVPQSGVEMVLPFVVGDYSDFYAGIHHATTVGRLFRPDQPLMPNYKYVPIGYHGRASSLQVSGQPVKRPMGQRLPPGAQAPVFGPSGRLDYELELGIFLGQGTNQGQSLPIALAADYIAGFCLLNDWSARDLQAWEYQPLGPFLAKSFATSLSPWVITPEALAPFRQAQAARPDSDPRPLDYLWDEADQAHGALKLDLEVLIETEAMRRLGLAPYPLSHAGAEDLYWTPAQLVTHHASNGCNLRPGDLLGTGTISGPQPDQGGSLLELSQGGKAPLGLPLGERRTFLEDGDEIILRARAYREGFASIGFGECRGRIIG